jgi:hypothetical protein
MRSTETSVQEHLFDICGSTFLSSVPRTPGSRKSPKKASRDEVLHAPECLA